ncbi:MAG: ATP-dependent DNA ligase [Actinomycetia bacterium]|nr:ATP-dependent DNA ligase [Actinomycetes bacterium]
MPNARLPFPPMEAELVREIPDGDGWQYEPKWDGFRGVLENLDGELNLWSRNERPLLRYFPELRGLGSMLPPSSALDGEIVIERHGALEFDVLQMRLHPAESRINRLAGEIPARFVAFDVLFWAGVPLHELLLDERRARLDQLPLDRSPASRDRSVALDWHERLEAAGFDGIVAKRLDQAYLPGSRDGVVKIKRHRTAECVVVGVRWSEPGVVATLLLGLYDEGGELHHVGSAAASAASKRAEIEARVVPLLFGEPSTEPIGPPNRWQSQKKALAWSRARPEAVVEVRFDKWQGMRFRHGTRLMRFRPDKKPDDCTIGQVILRPRAGDPTVDSLLSANS